MIIRHTFHAVLFAAISIIIAIQTDPLGQRLVSTHKSLLWIGTCCAMLTAFHIARLVINLLDEEDDYPYGDY